MSKHWTTWVCGCALGVAVSCSVTPDDSADNSLDRGRRPTTAEAGEAGSADAAASTPGGSPGAEPTPGSAGAGGAFSEPDPGAEGDTCGDIEVCVQGCLDDACIEACAARGSSTAQDLFDELLTCLDTYDCSDPDCLQLNCAAEGAACLSDEQAGGTHTGGTPATGEGTLPAALLGQWATSDGSTTYQFKADATYEYVFHYNSSLTCILYLSQRITEVGTVSVQGDTLTTKGTSRTAQTQDCNFKSSTDNDSGETQSYGYSLSGNA